MLQIRTQDAPAAARPAPEPFRINPDLDLDALARTYQEEGKVRIYSLLADGPVQLYEYLEAHPEWIHLISTADGALELDPEAKARLSSDEWAAIEAAAHERARTEFQYRYYGLRVPEEDELDDEDQDDFLIRFARLMQSGEMQDLLQAITGRSGFAFTDGQATAYDVGDFLTAHDDAVEGKERLAAFVYGLTPRWRLEWGGMLLFHGEMDRTADGFTPRFNTLDLFKVPRLHSVSEVTRSATHRRYAVTGWLRPRDI